MPSYSRKVEIPGKSAQELYDKVASDIERFMEKTPMGKMEIARDPAKKEVNLVSTMATATLYCKDGCLELEAKLSLLAAPFRSKLDDGIDRWLAKAFNL